MVNMYGEWVVKGSITPQLVVYMLQVGLCVYNDISWPLPSFLGTPFQWEQITYSVDGITG